MAHNMNIVQDPFERRTEKCKIGMKKIIKNVALGITNKVKKICGISVIRIVFSLHFAKSTVYTEYSNARRSLVIHP